jgi:hypothetical protein
LLRNAQGCNFFATSAACTGLHRGRCKKSSSWGVHTACLPQWTPGPGTGRSHWGAYPFSITLGRRGCCASAQHSSACQHPRNRLITCSSGCHGSSPYCAPLLCCAPICVHHAYMAHRQRQ